MEAAVEPRLDRNDSPAPRLYLPSAIEPEPALALYARTSGEASAVARPLRALVGRLDPVENLRDG